MDGETNETKAKTKRSGKANALGKIMRTNGEKTSRQTTNTTIGGYLSGISLLSLPLRQHTNIRNLLIRANVKRLEDVVNELAFNR